MKLTDFVTRIPARRERLLYPCIEGDSVTGYYREDEHISAYANITTVIFEPYISDKSDDELILQAIMEGGQEAQEKGGIIETMYYMETDWQRGPKVFILDAALEDDIKAFHVTDMRGFAITIPTGLLPRPSHAFGVPLVFVEDCPFSIAAISDNAIALVYRENDRRYRDCKVINPQGCLVIHHAIDDSLRNPFAIFIEDATLDTSAYDIEIEVLDAQVV